MADLNKVFLMGRLTFDPELRRTPGGMAVADLRMATTRSWTGRDGERRDETLYIDVTVWDRQAENCCQYLRKGSAIHVEGSLKMDTWADKNSGEKRSKISVTADRVQFLDPRKGDSSGGPDDEFAPSREPTARRGSAAGRSPAAGDPAGSPNGAGRAPASSADNAPSHGLDDGGEDDIPF